MHRIIRQFILVLFFSSLAHATSFTGLGDLLGGTNESVATGVSSDGQNIVGYSSSDSGYQAFIWTESAGLQTIQDLLIQKVLAQ